MLQLCRELKGVHRHDARIVIAGDDQSCGIARARVHVVHRRVRIERFEILGVMRRAVVTDPARTLPEAIKAQHIHNSDLGDYGCV